MKPRKPLKVKRISKNKLVAQWEKRCEAMWKEHAHLRDGDGCQVAIHFPEIPMEHSAVYQIDHCVKRGLKALFFDTRNSTKVCSKCNWAKFRDLWGVKRAIDEVVRKREGDESWADIKRIEQTKPICDGWKKVYWLEEIAATLGLKISELKNQIGRASCRERV